VNLQWKYKFKSGALQFTIFIAVIIALLLAGVVMLVSTHRYFIEQSKSLISNIQFADTGTAALLSTNNVSSDTLSLSLPDGNENQVVNVHLSHWGLFEKAYVKTMHRKNQFIKCSLLGSGINASERPALYLQETFKPLAVIGNTRIEGKAFLPEQGIRPGNINGNSYYGTQLVYGNIEHSKTEMPKLKYDYRKQLFFYLSEYLPQTSNDFIALEGNDRVINSFKDPVKGLFSEKEIVLDNRKIYGNIIIRSATQITVKRTCDLRDVILAAPVIIIEDGVKGNFQAIADTSIKIGRECQLSYPTALILIEKQTPSMSPTDEFYNKIFIDKASVVRGSICFFKIKKDDNSFMVNTFIGEQASVKGEIYCEGNLELKGNVVGTVYTNQFVANEGGTIFVNHIYNGRISSTGLPDQFGGILFEDESKTVMKWLY